jgi:hypothetical protein
MFACAATFCSADDDDYDVIDESSLTVIWRPIEHELEISREREREREREAHEHGLNASGLRQQLSVRSEQMLGQRDTHLHLSCHDRRCLATRRRHAEDNAAECRKSFE